MGNQASRGRVRGDPAAVRSGRIFLYSALPRRRRFSPGRFERGSVEGSKCKRSAIFVLENALRTVAGRIRAIGERKRGTTFSQIDRFGKSAGQCLLRFGGNARTETRAQTNQDRERREGPALNI